MSGQSYPPPYTPEPGPRRRYPRRRAGFWAPVLLIGIGVIALLANAGVLSADRLGRAADLWPLVLVVAGVLLVLRATLPRALAEGLGVVAVALALAVVVAYAAIAPPLPGSTSTRASAPLGSVSQGSLQLELGASDVHVSAGSASGPLYEALFEYPGGSRPAVDVQGGRVTVRDSGDRAFRWFDLGRRRATISLNSSIPWQVAITGGAARDSLDLQGLRLDRLEISGGTSSSEITLPHPSGTTQITISGGASSITIHRPSGVPVSVTATGGVSSLRLDGQGSGALGGDVTRQTADYAAAGDRYEIRITGGASTVTVDQG